MEDTNGRQATIRTGEILAWRAWRLRIPTLDLASIVFDVAWPKGEPLRAVAGRLGGTRRYGYSYSITTDPANLEIAWAGLLGVDGIHGFRKPPPDDVAYGYCCGINEMFVIGSVLLWGIVITHADGYRAEYAIPHSLDRIVQPPDMRRPTVEADGYLRLTRCAYGLAP